MSPLLQNYGLIRKSVGYAALEPTPLPKVPDDYILVRTIAVAVNPTDWTSLEATGEDGTLVGCDFAGTVEEIGPAVTKSFKKGDRVAGFAHGANDANPETGAFARYIICKGDIVMCVPDGVSWEEAATVGVGISTVGQGLYKHIGLPLPGTEASNVEGFPILIYGGSTATGTIAIQFAKLSGGKVYTTCSPNHFELVKSRGADFIYDYNTPHVGNQIREDTQNQLTQVFDTVAIDSTAAVSATAFGPNGGLYVSLLGVDVPRSDIKSIYFLGYDGSGESYVYEGDTYPASPETFTFAREFLSIAEKLWEEGKWKPHPTRVGSGGLIGVLNGMKEMKDGKVRGEKLVYLVDETEFP